MAKLAKLPGLNIIDGLKGLIDFYVYMGIPCARKWPRSPGHFRAPAVMEQWSSFTWAAQNWQTVSQDVRDAFNQMAAGTNMTGRDLFVKSYLSNEHIRLP